MKIAIIDHNDHRVFIEDIDDEILEGQYGGDEQLFIDENYDLEDYSWDWITDVVYLPDAARDPNEIDYEKGLLL